MMTREQVLHSLKHLEDPELHRSLAEFNLIRDILIKDDTVSVTLVLSNDDEPVRALLQETAETALREAGAGEVHIRFRRMTDFERAEVLRKIQDAEKGSGSAAQTGSAQQSDARQAANPLQSANVKFIAVASGKGGVGKSTVTVNLAAALARKGKRVGLIDADIYGFSVPDMMGIEERPQLVDNRIIPVERFGVKVISMGFFVEDNAPVIWRGPMLGKMLRNFFSEVNWGELDYLLLDLPPGTGDVALDVHQMIPQSKEILVTTPHATAAFVAARAGSMAVHTHHEILGVVENMAYYECPECGGKQYVFGRGGGAKLAEELHTELLAQIPLGAPDNHPAEPDFSPSVYKPETAVGQMYAEIAEKIIQKLEP